MAGQSVGVGQAQHGQRAVAGEHREPAAAEGKGAVAGGFQLIGLGEAHQVAEFPPAVLRDRPVGLEAADQQQREELLGVVGGLGQLARLAPALAPALAFVQAVAQRVFVAERHELGQFRQQRLRTGLPDRVLLPCEAAQGIVQALVAVAEGGEQFQAFTGGDGLVIDVAQAADDLAGGVFGIDVRQGVQPRLQRPRPGVDARYGALFWEVDEHLARPFFSVLWGDRRHAPYGGRVILIFSAKRICTGVTRTVGRRAH